jgi:hypothetical protein
MSSVQQRISLCTLLAAAFAMIEVILGAGCARVTTLDLQIAPPETADLADSNSAAISTAGPTPPTPGDILMIGGAGSADRSIASTEYFSAATGKFKTTGSMKTPRALAAAVAVPNPTHDVVIFGGMKGHAVSSFGALTIHATVLNSAQEYNGITGKFTTNITNPMIDARTGLTATVFPSGPLAGKVLIAGGDDANGPTNTAEIFDPIANTFTPAANTMTDAREFHTATLLNDGTVLIAGGLTDTIGDVSETADIFDPGTQKFTPAAGLMPIGHAGHTASLLTTGPNAGKVLLVDGVASDFGGVFALSEADLYDPASKTFSFDNAGIEARVIHTAVTLNDGRILLSGGMNGNVTFKPGKIKGFGSTSKSSEIYDPTSDTFTCINGIESNNTVCNPSMMNTRAGHTATLITTGPNAGKVLIAGGLGGKSTAFGRNDHPLKTAEIVTISGTTATSVKLSMKAARVGFAAVPVQ